MTTTLNPETYVLAYSQPSPASNIPLELGFLEKLFKKNGSRRILDLGSGPGIHSIPLAEKGYHCTLLDKNSENLEYAEKIAEKKGLAIKTTLQDLADYKIKEKQDAAVCLGNSFQEAVLSDARTKKHLASTKKALKTGGVYVLYTHNPKRYLPKQEWTVKDPKTGRETKIREETLEPKIMGDVLETTQTLQVGAEKHEYKTRLRILDHAKLEKQIIKAGFALVSKHKDWSMGKKLFSPHKIYVLENI